MNQNINQINVTLGTAGHIDHGKTALIRLLTGCETDRLKEEKERGMSIELGFAPCRMGNLEVGIVDVPGHENFIKTMVAGATGIDGVIFVVAADDGIMPQTLEHMDILTLLGVKHGLVALTKVDIVTEDRVKTVTDQLKQFLQNTFLANADICPLSTITGAGFDGFYSALKSLIGRITPKSIDGIFRMPVERTFSAKGFGTIISGIPASGSASVGDELILLPQGTKSRIRSIQVYGKDSSCVQSGQCAALNLPQIDAKSIERGNVLARGNFFAPAQWFLCDMTMLKSAQRPIRNGQGYKFHTGTSEATAAAYIIDNPQTVGGTILIQIRTEHAIVAGPNDRFILRDLSPMRTIAGGTIVEAIEARVKTKSVDDLRHRSMSISDPQAFIEYCLKTADAVKPEQIALRTKQLPETVETVLLQLVAAQKVIRLENNFFIHRLTFDGYEQKIIELVSRFHAAFPQSPGTDPESLQSAMPQIKPVFKNILDLLLADKKLILKKDLIALPSHKEQFDSATQKLLAQIESLFIEKLFCPPSLDETAAALKLDIKSIEKTVKLLTEQKTLLRVENGLYFHKDAIEQAKNRIAAHIKTNGGRLESVDFKYLIDTTRKYALPLLDYMDKINFTRRQGNTRYLK